MIDPIIDCDYWQEGSCAITICIEGTQGIQEITRIQMSII